MKEQFLIYLWSISENIDLCLFLLWLLGAIAIFILLIFGFCSKYSYLASENDIQLAECLFKWSKKIAVIVILAATCNFLIPSKKDLALIFLYPSIKSGTQQVIESDVAKKMYEVVNLYLDKQIKENLQEQNQ